MKNTNRNDLTQERLKELFTYDKNTGVFKRKVARGNQTVGEVPGYKRAPSNRTYIYVDGHTYFDYRLAWLYVYGRFPKGEIDHIDGDVNNCRISNLRDVSRTINSQNRKKPMKNNKIGFLGVNKRGERRYRARIRVNGKLLTLGEFATPEEAHSVYMDAKKHYHPGLVL